MFNRRDETGKWTWLFFLELTTDDGLIFIARGHAHRILLFKEGIIMSLRSEHKVCVWNETDGLKDFIGFGKEGSLDGKALQCELCQPFGTCWTRQRSLSGWLQIIMYQNHVGNDAHHKVFVRSPKIDAGVLYTRKKR